MICQVSIQLAATDDTRKVCMYRRRELFKMHGRKVLLSCGLSYQMLAVVQLVILSLQNSLISKCNLTIQSIVRITSIYDLLQVPLSSFVDITANCTPSKVIITILLHLAIMFGTLTFDRLESLEAFENCRCFLARKGQVLRHDKEGMFLCIHALNQQTVANQFQPNILLLLSGKLNTPFRRYKKRHFVLIDIFISYLFLILRESR